MNYGKYLVKAQKPLETTQIYSDDSLESCFDWASPLIMDGWSVQFDKPTVMKQVSPGHWEATQS